MAKNWGAPGTALLSAEGRGLHVDGGEEPPLEIPPASRRPPSAPPEGGEGRGRREARRGTPGEGHRPPPTRGPARFDRHYGRPLGETSGHPTGHQTRRWETSFILEKAPLSPTPCAGIFQSLPYRQLQGLSTLFSEFFASFPYGTCALSISHRVFSLGRSIPPD